jgi:hypothetical protein
MTLRKLRFIVDQYGYKLTVLDNFWRESLMSDFNKTRETVYGRYGKFYLWIYVRLVTSLLYRIYSLKICGKVYGIQGEIHL